MQKEKIMYYMHSPLLCTHHVPAATAGVRQSACSHGGYFLGSRTDSKLSKAEEQKHF